MEFDGGALMNQASHYVDLGLAVGPVESVSASMATLGRTIEVEDMHCSCVGAMERGTMAVTMLTYPKILRDLLLCWE